jgi:ABC-type phosphate/phosphonate transport system substrate-binding protein
LRGLRAVRDDGLEGQRYGYEMEIITYPGSASTKVEDIKGKKLAFTSQTSNSGFKAPSALLRDQFGWSRQGLRAGVLRQARQLDHRRRQQGLSGRGDRQFGDARMQSRGVVKKEQIKSRSTSRRPSRPPATAVYNLKPELAAKIKEAFFTFDWEGSDLLKEFNAVRAAAGEVHADHLQAALAGGARDRQGDGRQATTASGPACCARDRSPSATRPVTSALKGVSITVARARSWA